MMQQCRLCAEPLADQPHDGQALCLLCAHRTTAAERRAGRPLTAGVLDSA